MIKNVVDLLGVIVTFFKIPITIDTYTFSLWQVFVFVMLLGFVIDFIGGLING